MFQVCYYYCAFCLARTVHVVYLEGGGWLRRGKHIFHIREVGQASLILVCLASSSSLVACDD